MLRKVASKVAWVGRTASMVFGLALVMALMFGVASIALAGTGVGDTFNLGKQNTVNKISSLIGSASSAMLKIDNNGAGPALALQVEPGAQPMTVNSSKKVASLNADEVDGLHSTSFAGSGNSVYGASQFFCSSPQAPQVLSMPISVTKDSLVYASAHGDVSANGNADTFTLMNIELRDSTNTTTLAKTGYDSAASSQNATDIRPLVAEGVLKSNIATPSEAPFVVTPGNNYVLRLTVRLNGGTCTSSAPYLWDSSLSYILLGTP